MCKRVTFVCGSVSETKHHQTADYGGIMFTKEEIKYLKKEMNLTVECASRMLIKEDNDEIKREIKIAESILDKVRNM